MATSRGSFPSAISRIRASRRCSHWRETEEALWKVKERAVSTGTAPPDRADRSLASRSPSVSSAHTSTTGRLAVWAMAAATWARWTAATPDRAAGQRAPSMAASSS